MYSKSLHRSRLSSITTMVAAIAILPSRADIVQKENDEHAGGGTRRSRTRARIMCEYDRLRIGDPTPTPAYLQARPAGRVRAHQAHGPDRIAASPRAARSERKRPYLQRHR